MANITTRTGKGSALTHSELDDNFSNLNADKAELSGADFTGNVSVDGNVSVTGTVDGRDVAADGTKLDGVETGADVTDTANVVGSLTAGTNITIAANGTITATNTNTQLTNEEVQDIIGAMLSGNTETGITVSYQDADGTIDFVVDTQTDENFTTALKNKLDAIESGATADQTAAEIRALVESASDSNVFTDADHTKLDGIEASADVTDTTNVVASLTAGTNITIAADGTISASDSDTVLTSEQVQDIVGAMVSGNTETGITVTYQDADGTIDFVVASQTDENFTTTLKNKLDAIEASADVTDTTNVVASLTAGTNVTIDANGTISSTDTNTQLTAEQVQDIVGAMFSGNTETGIAVTYEDTDGTVDFVVTTQSDENFTAVLKSKLDGIEASADVTDTANVVASLTAGANITIAADGTIASTSADTYELDISGDTGTGSITDAETLVVFGGSGISTSITNNTLAISADTATATTKGIASFDSGDFNISGGSVSLASSGGAVDSVNTQTGVVVLDADDISDTSTTNKYTTASDISKLAGIEASADVTDATNVTAAGALMDSEVTNLAQVKAFDSADYATAAQGTTADNALPKSGGAMTGAITTNSTFDGRDVSADGTKLDGIEAGATADQTASEIRALVESASDSNVFTDADHTKLDGLSSSEGYLNVADFGATGDGTDQTTEIQNAINYASKYTVAGSKTDKHNQTIFFPDGHYKYSVLRTYYDPTDNSGYSQDISDGRLIFRGTGRMGISDLETYDGTSTGSNSSADKRLTGAVLESTGAGLIVDPTNQQGPSGGNYGNARNFVGKDITFIANNTGQIVEAKSCPGLTFDHCSFLQLGTGSGIVARNCWFFTFNQCFMVGQSTGAGISSEFLDGPVVETGNFAGLWTVKSSMIEGFENGIHWTGGKVSNFAVKDSAIQDSSTYGIYADDSVNTNSQIQQMTLDNVYFEAITATPTSFIKSSNDSIDQLYMQSCFMLGGGSDSGSDQFTSNGTTQTFTYAFDSPSATSDIVVTKNGTKLTETTNYTVNLAAKQVQVQSSAVSNNDTIIVKKGVATAKLTGAHIDLGKPSTVDINNTRVFRPPTKFLHIQALKTGQKSVGTVSNTTFVHDALTFDNYTTPIYLVTTGSTAVLPKLENNIVSGSGGIHEAHKTFQLYKSSDEKIPNSIDPITGATVSPRLSIGAQGKRDVGLTTYLAITEETYTEYVTATSGAKVFLSNDGRTPDGRLLVVKNSSDSTQNISFRNQPAFEVSEIVSVTPGSTAFLIFTKDTEQFTGTGNQTYTYSFDSPSDQDLLAVYINGTKEPFASSTASDPTGAATYTVNLTNKTITFNSGAQPASGDKVVIAQYSYNLIGLFSESAGSTGDITGVTAGTGLTGGGTSGSVTLNVSDLTVSELAAGSLQTSSESFSDLDTALMTAAAINDRIESFGYTTNTGDITGVTAGTGLTGGGASGAVTLNVNTGAVANGAATIPTGDQVHDFVTAQGYTSNVGDITGVTAGTGLAGGGTSGSVTLNVNTGAVSNGAATIPTGDHVYDFVTAQGYTTNTGDITGVTAGDGLSGGATSGNATLAVDGTVARTTGDTFTGSVAFSSGINGFTAGNGIGGTNFTISGVNELQINDPGEGIRFGGGSNTVNLFVVDDANDNIMNFSGAAQVQVNGTRVLTVADEGSGNGLDADTLDGQQGTYYYQASNPNGYTSNAGDITAVTAGTSLSGGGTSGSVTLNVATPTNAPSSAWYDVVAWDSGLIKDAAVELHGSGYLRAAYLNMTHSAGTRSTDTVFYSSTDDYIRKTNATGMRASLNVPTRTGGNASGTWGISITGSAGTLDGIDSSQFLRSDTSDTMTGELTMSGSSPQIKFNDTTASADDFWIHVNSNIFYVLTDRDDSGGWDGANPLQLNNANSTIQSYGNTVWTSGNDGSGSGLDADTVDGVHESTFMRRSANSQLDMNNYDIIGVDQIVHQDDSNTYMEFHNSDQWRVVTGGVERLEVNNSNMTVAAQLEMNAHDINMQNNDIVGVNGIFHHGDSDTYMYFPGGNTWAVTTGGTEAMRINSNRAALFHTNNEDPVGVNDSGASILNTGRIKLHCTSSQDPLVLGTRTLNKGVSFWYHNGSSAATKGRIEIRSSSVAYLTSSDERLKYNIVDAPSASADIDAIQVRSFDWKADGSHQKYGMIAQELQGVAPDAVSEGDEESGGMMGVDYSKLVPMMIKEIQLLRARVAQLEGSE